MLTAYRTAAFIESCPADQDIIFHYKVNWVLWFGIDIVHVSFFQEQLNIMQRQRESLQAPTKTHTIPDDVLEQIKSLSLDRNWGRVDSMDRNVFVQDK